MNLSIKKKEKKGGIKAQNMKCCIYTMVNGTFLSLAVQEVQTQHMYKA